MLFLKPFLFGVLLPAVVSGIAFVVAWRPWQRDAPVANGIWGGAIALSVGYVAGHAGLLGWPPFPPVEATQWLVYLALASGVFGLIIALWHESTWLRWGLRLLLSGVMPWLILHAVLKYRWQPIEGVVWLVGLGVAIFGFWLMLNALAERFRGASTPLVLLVVATGGSVTLLLSGSAMLGQLGGVLTAALGASLVIAWWNPKLSLAHGATSVVAILLAGLWMSGYFYAEVPVVSALLLVVSPATAWIGQVEAIQRLGGWKVALIRAAVVCIPVAIAVAIPLVASLSSADSYGY